MHRWARIVVSRPWAWIALWLIAAVGIWAPAPRIPTLLEDDASGFLPADSPSQVAAAILRREFPDSAPSSRAVVVAARDPALLPDDRAYLGRVAHQLAQRSDDLKWRIRAVELAPFLQPILDSPDGKAAILVADLPAEMLSRSSVRRVREIQQVVASNAPPAGLQVEITGAAAMGELLDANAKRDVDRTTLWAFGAVAVILLFIYRSPVAMLLPLVSIAVALLAALGLIGWAALYGWPINGLIQMFVVVIVVGSGVDYCLFLFARFREEAAHNADPRHALAAALVHSGPAIIASAATNAVGLATLALSRNRDWYTSGPTIAFAIALSALAVLSLTPALIRVVGPRWLGLGRRPDRESRVWRGAARLVTRFPIGVTLATLAVLVPTSVIGVRVPALYDALEEYPADSSFVRGARLYQDHFFGGRAVSELTILVSTGAKFDWPAGLEALRKTLDRVAGALSRNLPIAYMRDLQDPLGTQRGAAERASPLSALPGVASLTERLATSAYVGGGGAVARIDVGVAVPSRSVEAMQMVGAAREIVRRAIAEGETVKPADIQVDIAGESAAYADMRDLRKRDFRIIAAAACVLIYAILLALTRAPMQSLILIAATLVTYLATYGATYLVVHAVYGLAGLSWKISFLLFVIIMSLGQDYNIFVVARIHEELRTHPPREAIGIAIRRTGKVVSSCGIIMAATFASMFSGSLLLLKEFAIALPLGILIDTFVVRPLLVPALILLLAERKKR